MLCELYVFQSMLPIDSTLPLPVMCRNSLQHFPLPLILQIVEMDNILKDSRDQTLGQEFFQDVALHFRFAGPVY